MSFRVYMDVNVPYPITLQLRVRGVDVLTAQEDGAREMEDPDLLNRACALGRVLFTRDIDLLREAARRQRNSTPFAGVIYAHQLNVTIGQCIAELELLSRASHPGDWTGRIEYLPLK